MGMSERDWGIGGCVHSPKAYETHSALMLPFSTK